MAKKAFFMRRINDHTQYLKKIHATLEGRGDFQGTSHTDCQLGKWLYGEGPGEVAELDIPAAKALFDSLLDPHRRFHEASHEALIKQQAGDAQGARQAMTKMHVLSNTITGKLLELDKLAHAPDQE